MDPSLELPEEDVARLRGSLSDLVSVMALPALWAGGEPNRIVTTLLDALVEMLNLDFVLVRVDDPEGGPPVEMARLAESLEGTVGVSRILDAINSSLGEAAPDWPLRAWLPIGRVNLLIASARLGLHGEIGGVIAGARRPGFPAQSERLLLDVAANQAAVGLQHARRLGEQRRVARELDDRVAQRTRELADANDALRDSELNARLLVDNIPGLVALLKADGEVQFVNRKILEYTGGSLEEMKHWGTNGIVHLEDLPHVAKVFTESIESGIPYEIVQRLRRYDGVYRWFQNSGFPDHDSGGRVVRWCVLLTDIDERKRAEEALAASERNLTLIVDTIPALVWLARPDGIADFFNQLYLDFIGMSAIEASDGGWTDAVHPEDTNGLAATWNSILVSGGPGEAEARLRRSDGEYRWFLFRANPLHNETGTIIRWHGVNTDIEDRKRAETELRRAYDSFADAQRLSKAGSFITDLVSDDHNWSEETYRIFGFEPTSKVTLQRIQNLIHPDDLPSFAAMIAQAMTGVDVSFDFRITTAEATAKHIRGVAHVIEKVEGRPMFVGALQDVTESMIAEEALSKSRSELAHVSSMTTMSALTASIAHEVNQPLSGIITNAATCLRMLDANPPNIEGALETARRTIRDGDRASEVMARLRALFTRKEITPETFDLNEAAREVIALSSADLQRDRIMLQSDLAVDLPVITGDRLQLQQVILNLIRNASDAMADVHHHPRLLFLKTERDESNRVRCSVRDAGVGLPLENPGSVFGAFYTTKRDGMGIGLFVSRSIVERHLGHLWAEPNDNGPGATFTFAIPIDPVNAQDTASRDGTS